MARGSKASYSGKQKRQAEHIEEGYESRGARKKDAQRIAWATVNKETGGGKKSGSGRGKKTSTASSHKGGKIGGKHSHSGSTSAKTSRANKAAANKSEKRKSPGRPRKPGRPKKSSK
jgi:hypothetical protein